MTGFAMLALVLSLSAIAVKDRKTFGLCAGFIVAAIFMAILFALTTGE